MVVVLWHRYWQQKKWWLVVVEVEVISQPVSGSAAVVRMANKLSSF